MEETRLIKAAREGATHAPLVAKLQRNENHGRLEVLREEIKARLTTIRLALDNTHAKIVRIKTTGLTNARLESDNVSETLQNLQIETDVLLESIDEMGRS